jgi:thiol-disulfide isomerase/thioredoxin
MRMKTASPRLATVMALVALLLPATVSELSAQTRIGIGIGDVPAPLVLPSVTGEEIDLAESFGVRPVVLQFWATWCPKCEALAPQMRAAHEEFGDRVDFFGIAVAVGQTPRRIQSHLEEHPLPYPTLWDQTGEATRRFMAPTTSYVVILDADGAVAYTGVDVDQDVAGALRRIVALSDGG